MKKQRRKFSRKDFIKTSSMGALATGMIAGVPAKILAGSGEPGKTNLKMPAGSGKLEETTLGSTGIKMTRLGVGAPRIQEPRVLKYALDQGITFIDTGRRYANGQNEIMVGEAIKGRRKDLVIQSKVNIHIDQKEGDLDTESVSAVIRETFNKSLEESLKALQTDYIDIMLFHGADDLDILYHEAVLESFARAKKEGKILATGFSVHTKLVEILERHNRDPFYDVIMLSFNPHGGFKRRTSSITWDQQAVIAGLKKAAGSGTGIIGMKTCLGGPWQCEGDSEATYPGAVKWILSQPYIHAAAVAMASFQQLDEHLAVHKA